MEPKLDLLRFPWVEPWGPKPPWAEPLEQEPFRIQPLDAPLETLAWSLVLLPQVQLFAKEPLQLPFQRIVDLSRWCSLSMDGFGAGAPKATLETLGGAIGTESVDTEALDDALGGVLGASNGGKPFGGVFGTGTGTTGIARDPVEAKPGPRLKSDILFPSLKSGFFLHSTRTTTKSSGSPLGDALAACCFATKVSARSCCFLALLPPLVGFQPSSVELHTVLRILCWGCLDSNKYLYNFRFFFLTRLFTAVGPAGVRMAGQRLTNEVTVACRNGAGTAFGLCCASRRMNSTVSMFQRPPTSSPKTTSRHQLEATSSGYVFALVFRAVCNAAARIHPPANGWTALVNGETRVVSIARWEPCQNGSPCAMTFMVRSSTRWTARMLRSASRVCTVTRAPAFRHTRVVACSSGTARPRSTPARAQAERWLPYGSRMRRHRPDRSVKGSGNRSLRSGRMIWVGGLCGIWDCCDGSAGEGPGLWAKHALVCWVQGVVQPCACCVVESDGCRLLPSRLYRRCEHIVVLGWWFDQLVPSGGVPPIVLNCLAGRVCCLYVRWGLGGNGQHV